MPLDEIPSGFVVKDDEVIGEYLPILKLDGTPAILNYE